MDAAGLPRPPLTVTHTHSLRFKRPAPINHRLYLRSQIVGMNKLHSVDVEVRSTRLGQGLETPPQRSLSLSLSLSLSHAHPPTTHASPHRFASGAAPSEATAATEFRSSRRTVRLSETWTALPSQQFQSRAKKTTTAFSSLQSRPPTLRESAPSALSARDQPPTQPCFQRRHAQRAPASIYNISATLIGSKRFASSPYQGPRTTFREFPHFPILCFPSSRFPSSLPPPPITSG